jgi:type VII secretion effector (TIGR04197 family)
MARIRVNTEDLKNKAKDFDSAAEAFKRAGDDILAAAMSMPSYDGQLSGPARKAGYEIQKQARELSTALAGDAESLRKTAQAFEEVDNQTVSILLANSSVMISYPLINDLIQYDELKTELMITIGGGRSDIIAYENNGDTTTLWLDGQSIVINKNDPNYDPVLIKRFEDDVDEFCKYALEAFNILEEMIEKVGILFALLLLYPVLIQAPKVLEFINATFPELAAAIDTIAKTIFGGSIFTFTFSIKDYADLTKDFETAIQNATESYNDAEKVWNNLKNRGNPSYPP